MSIALTSLQHDALNEIFNISVGRAADALSQMVGEEIDLSVPAMRFCLLEELDARAGLSRWRRVDAVVQRFKGSFEGDAVLMFPDDGGDEVIRLVLAGLKRPVDLDELGSDALAEVGNVLLNACLSALADVLAERFDTGLPSLHAGRALDVLVQQAGDARDPVLFLHIQFELCERQVEGCLAFLMNLPSLEALRDGVDRFLLRLGQEHG